MEDLKQFTGTDHYYTHFISGFVSTDGVQYMAEKYEAFWLLDVAYSHAFAFRATEDFMVARLVTSKGAATFTLDDGNENILATQEIEFTDFPDGDFYFYIENSGQGFHVGMLPSER